MGLFQHKKKWPADKPIDETTDGVQEFFDEYFMELRNRGRLYYEKMVNENAAQFKQDLDSTVARVNTELKDYITKRLDEQFVDFAKEMKSAQDLALDSLNKNIDSLKAQHQELTDKLQKNAEYHDAVITKAFDEDAARMKALKETQDTAMESLRKSADELKQQQEQLSATLQKNIEERQDALTKAFEDNMAQIIEHYLLGALGDQYDLKAQLPSIIKQMEQNKQAIVDDMKL